MKKLSVFFSLLLFVACGTDTVTVPCAPPSCPTCPAPTADFQFELTSWQEPDHFVIQGTSYIGEDPALLTLPAKFKAELLKKNTPSYIVKMVEGDLRAEETSQSDWQKNSGELNVDYTTTAGEVTLSTSTLTPDQENLTGNTWELGAPYSYSDHQWQSFQHTESGVRILDNIKLYFKGGTASGRPCTINAEIWSAGKASQLSSTQSITIIGYRAEAWDTFYFANDVIVMQPSTEYWIKFYVLDTTLAQCTFKYQNTNVYASGQYDMFSNSVWSYNRGDLMFQVQFKPIYSVSGNIQTKLMDLGSVPTVDGLWRFQTLVPSDSTVTHEAWALDDAPGTAWGNVQRLGTETEVRSLANLGGGIVVAGTTGGNVYRSTDNGASFTLVQRLGTETYVYSLANLGNGIIIAGATGGNIYRSINNGVSFSFIQRLGTESNVYSLSDLGGGIVVAGTGPTGHIYRSVDSGASWSFVQRLGTEINVYSLSSLGGGIVVAGTLPTGHIYRSVDSGASWSFVQRLGTETAVYSLSSLGGGIVVAGTSPTGHIYRSVDSGASWSFVQRLGSETFVYSLSDLGGGIVVAGTALNGHIYRSVDSGASWSFVQRLGSETDIWSIIVIDGLKVLAGTGATGQIYYSGNLISLGTVTDGQAITTRSRYYAVKAALTAATSLNDTPAIRSIMARFPTYRGYSDNTLLGYEAALLSVSPLSQSIDDFKATSVSQVSFVLNFTESVSAYLAGRYPKNKEVKILLGFIADYPLTEISEAATPEITAEALPELYEGVIVHFVESDYYPYYTGIIKDYDIADTDTVTFKLDDFHIEWDAPVPRTWTTVADDKTWTDQHPADVVADIIQGYVTSTTGAGALLRGYTSLDFQSLSTLKAATPGWKVTRKITGKTEKARDLLEELRQILYAYFIPKNTGDVAMKRWNASESAVKTLTDMDFLTRKYQANLGSLLNSIVIYYNWIASVEEPTWYLSTLYKKGDYIIPTSNNRTGFRYECTTGGTTAATEPTWPTVVGNTVADNTATWTCRQSAQDNELKNYLNVDVMPNVTSIENWDEVAVKEPAIKDKWTRGAQALQVTARNALLAARYNNPAEKIISSVDMRFFELECGDIVNVSTRRAPSGNLLEFFDINRTEDILPYFSTSDTLASVLAIFGLSTDGGIIDKPFQVIKKNPDFRTYTLGLELLRV